MEEFPHNYRVDAESRREGAVTLTSPGLDSMESLGPPQFGGPGDLWSPETLLVAAIADCFVLSFRAVSRAARFEWSRIRCSVDGRLERVDGRARFTLIRECVTLEIPGSGDEAKAKKLLEKAERSCLITNSMTAATELDVTIERSA